MLYIHISWRTNMIVRNGEVIGLWGEDGHQDPLYNAVKDGNLEKAQTLVRKSANMTFTDSTGWSVFHLIAAENLVDFFEFVQTHRKAEEIKAGLAGKTANGKTPIDVADSQGHKDIIRAFILAGVTPTEDLFRPTTPSLLNQYEYAPDSEKSSRSASPLQWNFPNDDDGNETSPRRSPARSPT